ncbi:MAG: hypothetical protein KAS32_15365 [Candidatus Peribacteraceae bacterium]|nr:hypothetical protein [Candidatus Peribacteraceae bacterium]
MTDIFLGAIVSLLFLGLGKIYNRIDEIGKSLASRNNNKILASFNKIEESLDTIKNKI